jgi:hypothetical protein
LHVTSLPSPYGIGDLGLAAVASGGVETPAGVMVERIGDLPAHDFPTQEMMR